MTRRTFKLPIIATLVTFSAIVIMLGLGQWQLQRADEKYQRLQQIEFRKQQSPLGISDLVKMSNDLRDYPVLLRGTFLQQPLFFIDNQIMDGRIGYQVVAILNVDSDNVAVNLGWIAAPATRSELPEVSLPTGEQTVAGMIAIPSLNPMISETAELIVKPQIRLQQVDLEYLQQFSGVELLPVVILANDNDNVVFKRHWQPVVMPPEKHIAYAIQWFGLAIALLIVYLVVLFRLNKEQAQ